MLVELLVSALYGAIQGLTEFLPISSSGHLLLLHDLVQAIDVDSLTFDAALHLGTLLALLVFFRAEILAYSIAFFKSIAKRKIDSHDSRLAWLIIFACIPAGLAGYFGETIITSSFRYPAVIAVTLVVGGVLFLLAERFSKQLRQVESIGIVDTVVIGISQVFALIPGISRSGITIVSGMSRHLTRGAAARFSFLMSIPIVFVAGLKKLVDALNENLSSGDFLSMGVGIAFAAIFGFIAIRFLLRYTQKNSLALFAWYRFIVAAIIVVVLLVNAV